MGDVVILTAVRRPPSLRHRCEPGVRGEIALFTGVRIERWGESPPADPREPPRRPPRGRRGSGS